MSVKWASSLWVIGAGAILQLCTSVASAQVGEEALQAQAELGGGWLRDAPGGYGGVALTLELDPRYLFTARYHAELNQAPHRESQDLHLAHRALLEARYQLNVLAVIPWVSVAIGGAVDSEETALSLGGAFGVDWRLNPKQYLSLSGRYSFPHIWTLGVAFGWRFVLNDPFDP